MHGRHGSLILCTRARHVGKGWERARAKVRSKGQPIRAKEPRVKARVRLRQATVASSRA